MEQRFLAWVQEYQERLVRICRFYTFHSEEEKDLYQEVLIQIWKSMPRFREESSPGTWVYRIAVNTALMYRRTLGRRKEQTSFDQLPDVIEQPDPEGNMDQQTRMQWLREAIANLGELDRTIVLLYLEELSYDEIAEVTGLSVSNVGVRLNRIRKKLSSMIKTSTS